ncbi:MAG TPA: hypothetical protein VF941_09555 [Clostridia bacterium]
MTITLKINGNDKTFVNNFVSGRVLRKTFEMNKLFNKNQAEFDETTIDLLVNYVVEVYGKQFTIDEFYDGIDAKEVLPTIVNCIKEITGNMEKELNTDPNA